MVVGRHITDEVDQLNQDPEENEVRSTASVQQNDDEVESIQDNKGPQHSSQESVQTVPTSGLSNHIIGGRYWQIPSVGAVFKFPFVYHSNDSQSNNLELYIHDFPPIQWLYSVAIWFFICHFTQICNFGNNVPW